MSKPYDVVEALIDKYGVRDTLIMVVEVMQRKEEHIAYTWQDKGLAKKWNKGARIVASAISKLPKVPGIK